MRVLPTPDAHELALDVAGPCETVVGIALAELVMTNPAGTTLPPDAVARQRAPLVLTYSVEQLPSFDAAFYNRARAEVSKFAEVTVLPREATVFAASAAGLDEVRGSAHNYLGGHCGPMQPAGLADPGPTGCHHNFVRPRTAEK
jgi:hypothetical protein